MHSQSPRSSQLYRPFGLSIMYAAWLTPAQAKAAGQAILYATSLQEAE